MKTRLIRTGKLAMLFLLLACTGRTISVKKDDTPEIVRSTFLDSLRNKIDTLYSAMGKTEPGDWLYEHHETFVSFEYYKNSDPVRPDSVRKVIYLQPFDDLDSLGLINAAIAREYLEAFYGLKTVLLPVRAVGQVPLHMKRSRGFYDQILTSYFLDSLLRNHLPDDAAVMLGLTGTDLYPNEKWNYVFGQAYLNLRVGVWSTSRLCVSGKPSEHEMKDCLIRLLKTASHESGHMFSLGHCVKYKCILNGSNDLDEADRKPTWLCPDCLVKLCWNGQREPLAHFSAMKKFWEKYKGEATAKFYEENLKRLR